MNRKLGSSNIDVLAVGMGCWAIGGPWDFLGNPAGWGEVNDAESIRAIHAALDMGVTLFDTAANYGCGHSERILGQAVAGRRDKVIIATKSGYQVDEAAKNVWPYDGDEENGDVAGRLRADCEASLRRLNTNNSNYGNHLVEAGWRGIDLRETNRAILPWRLYGARRAGENAFRLGEIMTRPSRPYDIIGIAA